jgi:hypothetical protein
MSVLFTWFRWWFDSLSISLTLLPIIIIRQRQRLPCFISRFNEGDKHYELPNFACIKSITVHFLSLSQHIYWQFNRNPFDHVCVGVLCFLFSHCSREFKLFLQSLLQYTSPPSRQHKVRQDMSFARQWVLLLLIRAVSLLIDCRRWVVTTIPSFRLRRFLTWILGHPVLIFVQIRDPLDSWGEINLKRVLKIWLWFWFLSAYSNPGWRKSCC